MQPCREKNKLCLSLPLPANATVNGRFSQIQIVAGHAAWNWDLNQSF